MTERPQTPTPVLQAEGVSKTYHLGPSLVRAIQEVDLSVASGETIALKGPSGSGKTTLLNLLGLLDRPEQGVVRVDGVAAETLDENAQSDLRRDRFGFVFQTFNLVPVMTFAIAAPREVNVRPLPSAVATLDASRLPAPADWRRYVAAPADSVKKSKRS